MAALLEIIADSQDNNISLDNLLSGRYNSRRNGWQALELTAEQEQELIDGYLSVLGGWSKTQARMRRAIEYRQAGSHGIYKRLWAEEREGKIKFTYCAGQDYTGELQTLRNLISK